MFMQNPKREWVHLTFRMTASAESPEALLSKTIEQRFGDDATG
jgi:hypothetical protein